MIKLIGDRLRELRLIRKLTQKDLAGLLYMDTRTYSKLERGEKKSIDVTLLTQIAKHLEVNIIELLDDSNDKEKIGMTRSSLESLVLANAEMLTHIMKDIRQLEEKINELSLTLS